MIRRLTMPIFRLYMKYLLSSIQNIPGLFIWGREGVKWARDLVFIKHHRNVGLLTNLHIDTSQENLISVRTAVKTSEVK